MLIARPWLVAGFIGLTAASVFMPGDATAQQIYKIVGPDGRITFSDQPPVDAAKAQSVSTASGSAIGGSGLAGLPFELRQAASRYPVTLYTSPGCATCAEGRSMLVARGIPFSEKTVSTEEDVEALKRFSGSTGVPLLTIGSQQIKGYSDPEWTQFLDAAGYPKTSLLPASYVPSPATPLVAADAAKPAAAAASSGTQTTSRSRRAKPTAEATAPQPDAENPAGIQF